MERAHVHAWPALRTQIIDGWLWRSSGGASQRANSVSTVDFTGRDTAIAIQQVQQCYRALGARTQFQTFDDTSPPDLPAALQALGYQPGETTTTMIKRIEPAERPPGIEIRATAWDGWLDVYLNEITESRRAVNRLILDRVPAPRAFFGAERDGRIVSTALGVASHGCVVIECVTTRADCRRRGTAREVLAALEHWAATQHADLIGLQVVSSNAPAVALYQRLGFAPAATNRFWVDLPRGVAAIDAP